MINIVMGLPGSGKSTFIKNNFPNSRKIDLYDFQEGCYTYEDVLKSYEDAKEELLNAIKNKEDFVFEHTLLKAIRRKDYIDAIRQITDEPIELFVLEPSMEQYFTQCKQRKIFMNYDIYLNYMETYELPTLDEGFAKINIVY